MIDSPQMQSQRRQMDNIVLETLSRRDKTKISGHWLDAPERRQFREHWGRVARRCNMRLVNAVFELRNDGTYVTCEFEHES